MARRKRTKSKPLGTIWRVSDELWAIVEPILDDFWPGKNEGRPRADLRAALNGIIFRMRTGCQWNQLPREFGPKSTVHDWFQRWNKGGVMVKIWAALVEHCGELKAVHWEWQSANAVMGKARFGGTASGRIRPIGRRTARSAA